MSALFQTSGQIQQDLTTLTSKSGSEEVIGRILPLNGFAMMLWFPISALHRGKTIPDPDTLLKGPFIRILGQEADWIRYLAAHDLAMPKDARELYVDTMTAAIELAATGAAMRLF